LILTQHSTLPMLTFFYHDTATTEIYTLSLHDALPISPIRSGSYVAPGTSVPKFVSEMAPHSPLAALLTMLQSGTKFRFASLHERDRKSTRLNSSHLVISYAVFCLKKKNRISYPHLIHRSSHNNSLPCIRIVNHRRRSFDPLGHKLHSSY